jgi:hypothetical protein
MGISVTVATELNGIIYEMASELFRGGGGGGGSGGSGILHQFKSKWGLKELSNNPISLSRTDYKETIQPKISDYFVTEKTDGLRCFVALGFSAGVVVIVTASDVIVCPADFGKSKHVGRTILDAELMGGDKPGPKTVIKVFDILLLDGRDLTKLPFSERYPLIVDGIAGLSPNFVCKEMIKLDSGDYCKVMKSMLSKKGIDGLIFTPGSSVNSKPRFDTKNNYFDMKVYKYKDASQSTIDFLILAVPAGLLGKKPYVKKSGLTLYCLFCGINKMDQASINLDFLPGYKDFINGIPVGDSYFPIQFSPSLNPQAYLYYGKPGLHQQVGEFIYQEHKDIPFELVKIREDKTIGVMKGVSYGNNFRIAESTLIQLLNPLTVDDLCSGIEGTEVIEGTARYEPRSGDSRAVGLSVGESAYFLQVASAEFKPLTKLNNFVKAQLIRQLEGVEWVVDLASGKGQDLFTYNCLGVHNLICSDIDAQALEELNRRRYLMNKDSCVFGTKPKTNMHSYLTKLDLTDSASDNSTKLLSFADGAKIGAVVINLAIHYLIGDAKSTNNFMNLVGSLLGPGGKFIFTCFDGLRIFKLLESVAPGSTWDAGVLGAEVAGSKPQSKFSIRRDYTDKKFVGGLKIGVRHHFGGGDYYTESLVDVDALISLFEKKSAYKMLQQGSFGDMHDQFSEFNHEVAKKLSPHDKLYSSLYTYVTLVKK